MDGINFEELLRSLLVLGNVLQAGLIIVALIGGRFVKRIAWRGLVRIRPKVTLLAEKVNFYAVDTVYQILDRTLYPLGVGVVLSVAASILDNATQPTRIIEWAKPITSIVALYHLLVVLTHVRVEQEKAREWDKKLLRPALYMGIALHAFGFAWPHRQHAYRRR